jgi:superfamily II DNA or RNA helicase
MLKRDIIWPSHRQFKSKTENEPLDFFSECLCNSIRFDLMLGYFSSTAIQILSDGFASFLYAGGNMRLIINNVLSLQDKEAIIAGLDGEFDEPFDLSDIESLRKTLKDEDKHFFECLAWLISNKKIDIKTISPKGTIGISHTKSGVFFDGENSVAFNGSCNFTKSALVYNIESIDAFCDWDDTVNKAKVEHTLELFEKTFNEQDNEVNYIDPHNIITNITNNFGGKEIEELLQQEKDIIENKISYKLRPSLTKALERAKQHTKIIIEQIESEKLKPRFPYPEGPRPYQMEAYESWLSNDRKGLFAMATGTGKTITSLNCVLADYKTVGFYKFVVLVPTTALANQWQDEVISKFNYQNAVVCSSINQKWKEELKSIGKNVVFNRDIDYTIITTYATFKGIKFQTIFKDYFENDFDKITLIADEAHTMGSQGFVKVLPNYINKRIGLSATPERQFDETGNAILASFFSTTEKKYTYEYNMKTAIENNILSRYYYYPKIVGLEQNEQDEYLKISKELAKYIDPETGKYRESDYVNNLLIKRKNIIHKASNKVSALISIINEMGAENFKDAFIYIPEGIEVDYSNDDNSILEDDINDKIIDIYLKKLFDNFGLKMAKFTGETNNREQILNQFKNHKLDALLAMKCLDEGVDIPQTKLAIFCSSTGNPRQYIQRRGRVLRKYKGKEYAVIYDLIVKPIINHTDTDEKLLKIEKNIFLSELRRLINFSVLSENKDECLNGLERMCYDLGIDIYKLANEELENYN